MSIVTLLSYVSGRHVRLVTLLSHILADIDEFCNTAQVMLLAGLGESCNTAYTFGRYR